MNFQRGLDPKVAMGTGLDSILNEIDGVIINDKGQIKKLRKTEVEEKWDSAGLSLEDEEKELANNNFRKKNVIIGISYGKYSILRNRLTYDGPTEGDEKDLIIILQKLLESFRLHGVEFFKFPLFQKVTAKTIGFDLVSVQPFSAPIGIVNYLDYKYSSKPYQRKITKQNKKKWGF